MTDHQSVTFVRVCAPYQPGDVAGFPPARAQFYVDRRLALFSDAERDAPIDFAAMDREALVGHARVVLGFADEPPPEITDDEIRTALQAHADGMPVPPPADEPLALDQLDALDRDHLEAFAKTKAGFADIDPALSDDDLRAQIRTVAQATVSFVGQSPAKKSGKAK